MDIGKLLKLTLSRASVTLSHLDVSKKKTHDKSILSCCWEICKAICMYGMNKSSRSPPKLCILCFEKLQVKSNTMDVSLTSEIWSWIIPWVFSHSLGWNYTFHSIFLTLYSDVIKIITPLKGELSNHLIQHSHFVKEIWHPKRTCLTWGHS